MINLWAAPPALIICVYICIHKIKIICIIHIYIFNYIYKHMRYSQLHPDMLSACPQRLSQGQQRLGPVAFGAVAEGAGMTHLDAVELQEPLELRDALGVGGHHIDPADFHHGEVTITNGGEAQKKGQVKWYQTSFWMIAVRPNKHSNRKHRRCGCEESHLTKCVRSYESYAHLTFILCHEVGSSFQLWRHGACAATEAERCGVRNGALCQPMALLQRISDSMCA